MRSYIRSKNIIAIKYRAMFKHGRKSNTLFYGIKDPCETKFYYMTAILLATVIFVLITYVLNLTSHATDDHNNSKSLHTSSIPLDIVFPNSHFTAIN